MDNIASASDPAHIGRTPVNLAPSVIKAPFMRQARPEQIPPRCMEDALRLARRAGGIEDEQRLLCLHGCRFALSIHLRRQLMIPMIAASLPSYITARGLEYIHRFQDRRQLSRIVSIATHPHFLSPPTALVSGVEKPA